MKSLFHLGIKENSIKAREEHLSLYLRELKQGSVGVFIIVLRGAQPRLRRSFSLDVVERHLGGIEMVSNSGRPKLK